jgi:hypothetical protein
VTRANPQDEVSLEEEKELARHGASIYFKAKLRGYRRRLRSLHLTAAKCVTRDQA